MLLSRDTRSGTARSAGEAKEMFMDKEQRIRERAHRMWEDEGRPMGRDSEHWQRAMNEIEDELRKEAEQRKVGINEVPAANMVVHEGPTPDGPLPGFEPADGINTPGIPAKKPKGERKKKR